MRARTSQLFTVNVPPLVTIMLPPPPPLPCQASLTLGSVLLTIAVPPLLTLPLAQLPVLSGMPPLQFAGSFHEPVVPVPSLACVSKVDRVNTPARAVSTR